MSRGDYVLDKSKQKYLKSLSKTLKQYSPYKEWASNIQDLEDYFGLSFMRVREELDIPGKVILPWEISKLKSKTRSGSK